MAKITQAYDGQTFTFTLNGQTLEIPKANFGSGAEIEKKVLAWARAIDPKAEL